MAVVLDLVNNPRPRHPEKAHRPDLPVQKKPDWIRVKAPVSEGYFATQKIMRDNGLPGALDPNEPSHVADATAKLGLAHIVVTSVDRDDLPDGGARHFAETIRAIRK